MDYFSIFFQQFNKPRVNILRAWTTNTIHLKFWEDFRKFWKNSLRKLLKCTILAYFSKDFTNNALKCLRFFDDNQNYWKFWENLRKFWINFLGQFLKMHYFSKSFRKLTNHPLIFRAFGGKTQRVPKFWENCENLWWKFYRKMESFIFYFLEILLLQIEPSQLTPFFYNNSFGFVRDFPHFPPLATPLQSWNSYE